MKSLQCSTNEINRPSLTPESKTYRQLQLNYKRAKQTDHSPDLDQLAANFNYEECKNCYWNPPEFSLLYGTPFWEQASESQKIILNQLYWVAYYSQIISAEIATIFFNQTSATGLYSIEGFRLICDTLDLETRQERSHINAFRRVIDEVENKLFGERIFSFSMRSPFRETMIFADTNSFKNWWKSLQLHCFGLLSAGNTFLACQYLTVRGIRTLNGKLVQHRLSNFHLQHPNQEKSPIPAQISYHHFLDESFHFNTSTILSHDVSKCLKPPTYFERYVTNLGIRGCQKDHYHVSVAINGIFWYEPALYGAILKIMRSPLFGFSMEEAKAMLKDCFTKETEGLHRSFQTHDEAISSYQLYLEPLDFISAQNKTMKIMASNSFEKYLKTQKQALAKFFRLTQLQNSRQ
ncbi:P-aminobenzoate N-oxygenase AurF [Cyanobacterium aponinum AL20118]|uniref:p-aminobenzoate N-oxygenase AurF n=1 Tax=Cyanobacterium aponinum AL20115 TaxID=3090662 RepID=A0AAF1C2Z5_9CHRO|nr:P-aminobenzoate N-oxygenase AurF [Cyanobacterium aponinum]WPF90232.1 P-aminobenzoate N-oxygenase AurF [Cyanobacterium aponinum AL20115]